MKNYQVSFSIDSFSRYAQFDTNQIKVTTSLFDDFLIDMRQNNFKKSTFFSSFPPFHNIQVVQKVFGHPYVRSYFVICHIGAGDLLTADSFLFVVYSLSKSANVMKILNYNDVSHENIRFFNITTVV
jgi:hypothetical protein